MAESVPTGTESESLPATVTELVPSVLAHRLALARQTGDALEERRAVGLHLKRILSALPPPV